MAIRSSNPGDSSVQRRQQAESSIHGIIAMYDGAFSILDESERLRLAWAQEKIDKFKLIAPATPPRYDPLDPESRMDVQIEAFGSIMLQFECEQFLERLKEDLHNGRLALEHQAEALLDDLPVTDEQDDRLAALLDARPEIGDGTPIEDLQAAFVFLGRVRRATLEQ